MNGKLLGTFILILLSCASTFGADGGIQVFTTTRTNAANGRVYTKDVFIRDGQTNLVRNAASNAGVVQIRTHRFYHAGALVGMLTETPDSSSTMSEPGCPFALVFEYGSSNQLKYAAILGKDGIMVDAFACTNGILFPVASSELSKAVEAGSGVMDLISHARGASPEQFRQETMDIVEKLNGNQVTTNNIGQRPTRQP